jgi:hypothetical protein
LQARDEGRLVELYNTDTRCLFFFFLGRYLLGSLLWVGASGLCVA